MLKSSACQCVMIHKQCHEAYMPVGERRHGRQVSWGRKMATQPWVQSHLPV